MSKQTVHPRHPPFSSLPLDPNGPNGNAWGMFGLTDELGMLNLLTPAVVASAATEIVSGIRISLDWPLDKPTHPLYKRKPFEQQFLNRGGRGRVVNDDILCFNTQGSSQWDGFRHYGYLKEKRYFNGHTQEELETSSVLGTQIWANSGGIVGRGILLDYADWALQNSIQLEPLTSVGIPFEHLQRVIRDQSITFRSGDILFIRSGFGAAYDALSDADRRSLSARLSPDFIGVEASEEILRWLWDNQFAAVAGDAPSFERSPPAGPHANMDVMLHQWLLAGWGMPIGELFDLEVLSKHCKETQRRSFFLSSVPLKVTGGVASPPNALAIF